MAKARSHHLEPFGIDFHMVNKPSQLDGLLSKLTDDPVEWNSLGQTQTYHGGEMGKEVPSFHVVICLDYKLLRKDPKLMLRTVAHEATHAAGMTLDHLGETYDGCNETLAYLVGWLTTWCWDGLKGAGK